MRIGLNATCLNDRPSGAKQRFVGIYSELIRQMPDDEFIVFEPSDCRMASWFDGVRNVTIRHTSLPSEGRIGRFVGGLSYWRSALKKEALDVFEGFNLPLVTTRSGRNVMTIHDLRGLHSSRNAVGRMLYASVLDSALARADQLITVSEAMKQELIGEYPDAKVAVVYNGLDLSGFVPMSSEVVLRILKRLSIPQDFLLAVGHFEPRKNYLLLIDALALLRQRGCLIPLVIIGNDSGGKSAVEERVQQHGLQGSVTLLSGLTDMEVRCAYQACNTFVFPSSYEGFGIPILEAMAADRPTVLSDIPVFREITEGLGEYFPPEDMEAMADAIEKVSGSTHVRRHLVEYGRSRVRDFAFENLAAQVEVIYRRLDPSGGASR
jgi:glycosyltransferase involved in cell wall biosynthesis